MYSGQPFAILQCVLVNLNIPDLLHLPQAPQLPGTHYFICGVGSHCLKGGTKATVRLSNDCSSKPYYGLHNKALWTDKAGR